MTGSAIQLLHAVAADAVSITVDRHTNLLIAACKAIEAAIVDNDAAEVAQGFEPMTPMEIAGVMGNVVGAILGERGISRRQFDAILGVSVWGEAVPPAGDGAA